MRQKKITKTSKQRGAALIVSLIILLVMTLIGVTSMQTTVMQEKMAGNSRDLSIAFHAAEGAARFGETWLAGLTALPDPNVCLPAPCLVWDAYHSDKPLWQDLGNSYTDIGIWTAANARNATLPLPAAMQQPQFFVELVSIIRDGQNMGQQQDMDGGSFRYVYAVTTRGTGGTTTANAFVQTNFARRF